MDPTPPTTQIPGPDRSAEAADVTGSQFAADAGAFAWRDELSSRLHRYRARRKAPPPRYPSLRLPFETGQPHGAGTVPETPSPAFETIANHALAVDERAEEPSATASVSVSPDQAQDAAHGEPAIYSGAKIIEFPGFAWGPSPPSPDQLAEPVSDRPRIMEVPEVAPLPPALGGITVESPHREEAEKRPGIDVPLQGAPLSRRLVASLIDALIVAGASALFGFIFWKIAGVRPPRIQILGLAAGVPFLLWHVYQYVLIVYAATTIGLRATGLRLARFDGTATRRSLRRWRVLAACLSAVSLGMGYAWIFLDEDALCWHDRITHTHLAPRGR